MVCIMTHSSFQFFSSFPVINLKMTTRSFSNVMNWNAAVNTVCHSLAKIPRYSPANPAAA